MYRQQQHPIDDMLRQHIHGVSVPVKPQRVLKPKRKRVLKTKVTDEQSKKLELSRFGYYYKDNGEVVYSDKQKVKNKALRKRQFNRMTVASDHPGTLIGGVN